MLSLGRWGRGWIGFGWNVECSTRSSSGDDRSNENRILSVQVCPLCPHVNYSHYFHVVAFAAGIHETLNSPKSSFRNSIDEDEAAKPRIKIILQFFFFGGDNFAFARAALALASVKATNLLLSNSAQVLCAFYNQFLVAAWPRDDFLSLEKVEGDYALRARAVKAHTRKIKVGK